MRSSLFGEEFLSAPIHFPLSGHLIIPSMTANDAAENATAATETAA
jgi:hypothetical protein